MTNQKTPNSQSPGGSLPGCLTLRVRIWIWEKQKKKSTMTSMVVHAMACPNYFRISGIYSNETTVPRKPSWMSSQPSRSTFNAKSPATCELVIKKNAGKREMKKMYTCVFVLIKNIWLSVVLFVGKSWCAVLDSTWMSEMQSIRLRAKWQE